MYHVLLEDVNFWLFLLSIDKDLATSARRSGCPCGGRLHCANYLRNPRGGPDHLAKECCYRLSFCCGRDGCRKRVTPPSTRFLGPKVYLAAVILLAAANRQGPSPRAMRELSKLFGADRRTIALAGLVVRALPPQPLLESRSRRLRAGDRGGRPSPVPPRSVPSHRRSPRRLEAAFVFPIADHHRGRLGGRSPAMMPVRAEDTPPPRGGSRLGWSGESPFHPIREEH